LSHFLTKALCETLLKKRERRNSSKRDPTKRVRKQKTRIQGKKCPRKGGGESPNCLLGGVETHRARVIIFGNDSLKKGNGRGACLCMGINRGNGASLAINVKSSVLGNQVVGRHGKEHMSKRKGSATSWRRKEYRGTPADRG